jgi:glycosyltransferase involved in cell wall biosynthesis
MSYKVLALTNDWGRPGCEGKYGGIGWYRTINPLEKIGCDVERGEFRIGMVQDALAMKERGDIWYLKPMGDINAVLLTQTNAKFSGAKIVLDIDDDPFAVDRDHPEYEYHKAHEELMRMQIENVDHIVVSTEPLKKVLSKYHERITVIPNTIDPAIWDFPIKKHKSKRIRLGWVGSGSHLADRDVVKDAIHVIMKKYPQVDFCHAGMCLVDGKDNREFSYAGTKGYEEYPEFLNSLKLDIAIAPIKNNRFNRSKSNIKWLEHGMLKTPMVLSHVTTYSSSVTHGVDGFLAKTTDDWVKYLSLLIESPELRKEIGENAYKKINEEWLVEKHLHKYKELFEKLMPKNITVYTSIVGGYDELNEKQNTDGAHFVAFTDKKSETWITKPSYTKFKDPSRNSRIQKIMPHLFIDTEYSIYMDGNFELAVPPQEIIDMFLKDKDIAVFNHGVRDCIYQEAEAILGYGKESKENMIEQVQAYAKRGIKEHAGLFACGVIIRRHTKRVNELNEKWWAEYCRYSKRDQMSFTVVFPHDEINIIGGGKGVGVYDNPYFKYLGSHK